MSLNKIGIYIERNTKIEYRKYTIYKATSYLKTILLKNVFLKRSEWMAGIAGDLFLKLYLVILVSGHSSKRVVRDTRNLATNSMILHFK